MAQLGGIALTGEDLYGVTANPTTRLGTLGYDEFGGRFRYAYAGESALVTGNLLQEPAESTNWNNMAVNTVAAIGATDIEVTLGGTATTADLFKDGLLFVSYATGIGQTFRIKTHDVQSTPTGTCTFTVDRPLKIALDATSKVTVRKNPYNGVIQTPATTSTGGVVGVALTAQAASYYGWIQSGGLTSCLADTGTNFANGLDGVSRSLAVAGSVKPQDGLEGEHIIGTAMNVTSTNSYMLAVHLMLD
jgi:hypothetical protein